MGFVDFITAAQHLCGCVDPKGNLHLGETPEELLQLWRLFVDGCETGYNWEFEEFVNDIYIRQQIETLLTSEELALYPEHSVFATEVEVVDSRYRTVIAGGPQIENREGFWWLDALPRYGGPPFVASLLNQFGIDLPQSPG